MQLFIEQLINGCALGALYALFGLGFGIVFATLGILNAAHGSYASWAAIAALAAVEQLKLPFIVALPIGVVAGGCWPCWSIRSRSSRCAGAAARCWARSSPASPSGSSSTTWPAPPPGSRA